MARTDSGLFAPPRAGSDGSWEEVARMHGIALFISKKGVPPKKEAASRIRPCTYTGTCRGGAMPTTCSDACERTLDTASEARLRWDAVAAHRQVEVLLASMFDQVSWDIRLPVELALAGTLLEVERLARFRAAGPGIKARLCAPGQR